MGQGTTRNAHGNRPQQAAETGLTERVAALEAELLAPVPRASHTAAVDVDDLALLLDHLATVTRAARAIPVMPQDTAGALERIERTVRAHGRPLPDLTAGGARQPARPQPPAMPAAVPAARRHRVPAAPTTLRLRALIVMRWPLPELSARSGVALGTLRALAGGQVETTSAETEQAIVRLSTAIGDQPGPMRPDPALVAAWASSSPAAAGPGVAGTSRHAASRVAGKDAAA